MVKSPGKRICVTIISITISISITITILTESGNHDFLLQAGVPRTTGKDSAHKGDPGLRCISTSESLRSILWRIYAASAGLFYALLFTGVLSQLFLGFRKTILSDQCASSGIEP